MGVAIAFVVVVGVRWSAWTSSPPPVGMSLGASIGVDFAAGRSTLVLFLQSGCRFCRESMGFYRRLMARDTADVQIIVAAPARDAGLRPYLLEEGVEPDGIVYVDQGELPVVATPTLLVIEPDGRVSRSWVGRLDDEGEGEVFAALFGKEAPSGSTLGL